VGTFEARVSRLTDLTHDVRQIDLAILGEERFQFAAGQFVSFEVARPGFAHPLTRPYSIASAPGCTHVELVLNLVPGGTVSPYLFGLNVGDRTVFTGPTGTFCLPPQPKRELLFVATGTGIAPVRSMLLSLARDRCDLPVTLFWGLRSERDVYYQDELTHLQDILPQFSFTTTLTRPSGQWDGAVGTVTSLVESRIASVAGLEAFVCGNEGMIRDVTAALRRKGLCPIHREQYYREG
jgi:NAD(P)H-flavin reductase